MGQREAPRRTRWGRRVVDVENLEFELDVLDVPGSLFASGSVNDQADRLIDHLQDCDGIVYLLDPEQEVRQQDSFRYFYPIMQQLSARVMTSASHSETHLPQHVAVCMTKFDIPSVYRAARIHGFTIQEAEPPYQPSVPDEFAEDFYRLLVKNSVNNTDLLEIGLRRYFSQVRYFVTSAIGFHLSGDRFRPVDYANVERVGPGPHDFRMIGAIRPINVLEPLLWLYDSAQAVKRSEPRT